MAERHVGVAPVTSRAILDAVLGILERKGAFATLLDPRLRELASKLYEHLPSHYLPDIYLEQPLLGTGSPRVLLVTDAPDRCYLDYASDGSYLAKAGIPQLTAPEDYNLLCGLAASNNGVAAFTIRWSLDEHTSDEQVIVFDRTSCQGRFSRAPHRASLLDQLKSLGCEPARAEALDLASTACGIPCRSEQGNSEWIAFADPAYLLLRRSHGQLTDCRIGIVITDRLISQYGSAAKPTIAYQWHITDNCDQRCKHCYLFAEDAQARCISTPFSQLMRTLDEIEDAAARRHELPELAVTGGDPLLHPRFWDFARELHQRGIRWTAMGNPFHLSEDVCLRLRQLGCYQYQMSLDGLEDFHDRLRKPGSYAATLAAIPLITGAGLKAQLMATASKQNLNDILACMDVAVEHGATSFAFARYCATSPEKAAELYPTPEEYRAFLLAYWEKKRAYEQAGCPTRFKTKDHLFVLLRWELGDFVIPEWSRRNPERMCGGCNLGGKSTIASNGDLLACRRMDSVVGNISRDHLYDVDTGDAMRAYAQVDRIEKCRECELLMWCRGCRAVGVNASGNLQATDPMCWHEP